MSILYNDTYKTFNIKTNKTSYCLGIHKSGVLLHLYYGRRIEVANLNHLILDETRENLTRVDPQGTYTFNTLPMEIGYFGNSDYRTPSVQLESSNGSRINKWVYKDHKIYNGKKPLKGLPATYDDRGVSIDITLWDEIAMVELILSYHVFEDSDTITRSMKIINKGNHTHKILKAMTLSFDMRESDFNFKHLSGRWGCERQLITRPLVQGTQSIESRAGISSHIHSPSVMLSRKDTTEHTGEVYGFSLVYSGNFLCEVEVSEYQTTRVLMGINPFEFSWLLTPNDSFQCPEVVMVYSKEGFNGMSQSFHATIKNNLLRFDHKRKERPVLINNWEATYFDFNEDKLLDLAKCASHVGVELFVLDDGWFGDRNSDQTGLGDWVVNREKLPSGLEGLSKRINQEDMHFGLWFEPEMVSKRSNLYKAHPEWAVQVPGRPMTEERNQFLLDFTKEEVRTYIIESVSKILALGGIEYVKWDMNRKITESFLANSTKDQQMEFAHRYMLGVYEVMDTITSNFPSILFEGCTSGGGRFDMGMLYYMPQFWTSDNTDAYERLKIQYATSLFFPQVTMGSHVSEVPNHQVNRKTDLKTRTNTAFVANLGYELDMTQMTADELQEVKEDIRTYKSLRPLLQFGDFYRLKNPFESNIGAWQVVNATKCEAVLYYQRVLGSANMKHEYVKFVNLNENYIYRVNDSFDLSGEILMNVGLPVKLAQGDFQTELLVLKKVE